MHRYVPFLQVSIRLELKKKKLEILQPVSPSALSLIPKKKKKNKNRMESIFILYKPETVVQPSEAAEGRHKAREP